MKKKYMLRKGLAFVSVALIALSSMAQSSSSGYFLEGYSQRYKMNPAFAPERKTFVAVPVLSNINMAVNSNVGVENFIFDSKTYPGKLTTFMSKDVLRADFLNKLPDMSKFDGKVDLDILSVGIAGKMGFTTFNIGIRHNEYFGIPKDMFGFMKSAFSDGNYNVKDVNLNTTTYLEFGLYHSHQITDYLTVGMGVKFLDGVAYADVNIDELDATISEQAWKVRTNATVKASIPGQEIRYDAEKKSVDFGKYSFKMPSSFGFAVDLGAEYDMEDIVEGLKLSASATDLGLVSWKDVRNFATDNNEYVQFSGFSDYDVMSKESNPTADKLSDDLQSLVNLYDKGTANQSKALEATFRLGADYDFPFVKWLSFGELLTLRTGAMTFFETRTSATASPCDWFDFSINAGYNSFGGVFGAILNFHPEGINFFLAFDGVKAQFNKQMIPVNNSKVNVSLGLTLVVGDKR